MQKHIVGIVALIACLALLSGCSMLEKKLPAPCGVGDYVETAVGTKITGVALPTDEADKTYTIVTPKNGFWMSLDCHNRIGR